MIRKLARLAGGACAIGATAGALTLLTTTVGVTRNGASWTGATLEAPSARAGANAAALMDTGHFGISDEAAAAAEALAAAQAASPAPAVLSVAKIDGDIVVLLRGDSGEVSASKIGDTVSGDWRVESADLDRVTLSRPGSRIEIALFAYM
ncbi:MAG: hypothetical protein AAGC56_12955 [Pseudomonadota bacterium]